MRRLLSSLLWVWALWSGSAWGVDISQLPSDKSVTPVVLYATTQACDGYEPTTLAECPALQLSDDSVINLGFTDDEYWFTFSLLNTRSKAHSAYVEIAYPLLDHIDFNVVSDGKVIAHYSLGDRQPYAQRLVNNPNFIVPVDIPANQSVTIVFEVSTGSSMQVPVHVWASETMVSAKAFELLLAGLFIGAMFVMGGYNCMLYFSTRDRSYLLFASMLFFYGLVESDLLGISYALLWPDSPAWNNMSLVVVSMGALSSLALFSKTFLQLARNSRKTRFLLNLCLGLCTLILLLTPMLSYRSLIMVTAALVGIIPALAYVKSVQLWYQGVQSARYFVVAFSLFVACAGFFAISKFGGFDRSFFTEYSIHFGAISVVTLISLALADQVNAERRDKEKAQSEAIHSLNNFASIYNNSTEGLVSLDANGRFTAANPAFLAMFGVSSLQQLQTHFDTLDDLQMQPGQGLLTRILALGGLHHHDVRCQRADGEAFWAMINSRIERDDNHHIVSIECSMQDISERKQTEGQLRYLADYDQLTGLINRNAFQERLDRLITQAREHPGEHALLYIDLDRFKLVNDTCGHLAGDELLKQLAVLFTQHVRQRDATARIGGDEFAILLEHCTVDKATKVADTLKTALSKYRFSWQGKHFDVGASIGVVPINQYSQGMVNLMNLADSACLLAKEQGRNRVVVHDETETLSERIRAKDLLTTIHQAIDGNDFILYGQPIVDLKNPDFKGYEVLLRLEAGEQIIGPGVFIPTAERYNVMAKIDRWVIEHAMAYLAECDLSSTQLVTINLSGQTLSDPDFLPLLIDQLAAYPHLAQFLCFELTESAALNNLSDSSALVQKMKEMGVKFAVDDFGSGYASYSYLTQLPIDYVKIDGSFCQNIDTDPLLQTIVKSITEICHMMDTKVIAEFVESQAALDCLVGLGVDMAQGFYLGKPAPLTEI
ncbi:EAL domain-containing protein [Aestuariibacter halophilus]|uniref:EAL domain-containing protein n=1 Tax=Fluctibacter halophilus TaxID=226011 RepID=A0ABS8GAT4_9ALTE|nr:EAL domain-containing protein [Aestuariibacter halophilus]MCC2617695.1 EAL domain-containing protein [Aestuariibacter halophilus]